MKYSQFKCRKNYCVTRGLSSIFPYLSNRHTQKLQPLLQGTPTLKISPINQGAALNMCFTTFCCNRTYQQDIISKWGFCGSCGQIQFKYVLSPNLPFSRRYNKRKTKKVVRVFLCVCFFFYKVDKGRD